MIPTMIVLGVVLGRWWVAALVAAAVIWPVLLVRGGAMTVDSGLLVGALYGVVNAAVGVAVHQGVLAIVRQVRLPEKAARRREVAEGRRDES